MSQVQRENIWSRHASVATFKRAAICSFLIAGAATLSATAGTLHARLHVLPSFARGPFGSSAEEHIHVFGRRVGDGRSPSSALIGDEAGTLYGTTGLGGNFGDGTVFKLTPSGSHYVESVVHAFRGGLDGAIPYSELIADRSGALYGTASAGGDRACNCGAVFKLTPDSQTYRERVIYRFKGPDGADPVTGLVIDSSGVLYGTTLGGGNGVGTVFSLTPSPSGYKEHVLYAFQGGSDGSQPRGTLLLDKSGSLYGTTTSGGAFSAGTVFTLMRSGSAYTEKLLYSFTGGIDGGNPAAGVVAHHGSLYGTTSNGGSGCGSSGVCGTVFELTPAKGGYSEKVLHSFTGRSDGGAPEAPVTFDATGTMYGTTDLGGLIRGGTCVLGCGVVYAVIRSGSGYSETVLHAFQGKNNGQSPLAGLFIGNDGVLYGTTFSGGHFSDGVVFAVSH